MGGWTVVATGDDRVRERTRADQAQDEVSGVGADRFRSAAQLDMLHSLAAKLSGLGSVEAIGEAIAAELRTIVEYHNCRVICSPTAGRSCRSRSAVSTSPSTKDSSRNS